MSPDHPDKTSLIHEIGSGPGYFVHAGENEGHAVIVKVFNAGPNVRERLDSTVALSKGLIGNLHWKKAEGPRATALKDDLERSITLGFKLVTGLSSFDVFLDIDDRFLIRINSSSSPSENNATPVFREQEEAKSWDIFNTLCRRILVWAARSGVGPFYSPQFNRFMASLFLLFEVLRPGDMNRSLIPSPGHIYQIKYSAYTRRAPHPFSLFIGALSIEAATRSSSIFRDTTYSGSMFDSHLCTADDSDSDPEDEGMPARGLVSPLEVLRGLADMATQQAAERESFNEMLILLLLLLPQIQYHRNGGYVGFLPHRSE
ncbi:hypothetical protein B0H13DRAFT_1903443 [Mycena leptocephala]|nr:hypothetical protein B0H13DRAFT_1903443 [Mycena leptocephala]